MAVEPGKEAGSSPFSSAPAADPSETKQRSDTLQLWGRLPVRRERSSSFTTSNRHILVCGEPGCGAWTAMTGARTGVIWFKACPVVMSISSGLLIAASFL